MFYCLYKFKHIYICWLPLECFWIAKKRKEGKAKKTKRKKKIMPSLILMDEQKNKLLKFKGCKDLIKVGVGDSDLAMLQLQVGLVVCAVSCF